MPWLRDQGEPFDETGRVRVGSGFYGFYGFSLLSWRLVFIAVVIQG